jgi:hypothetical protein
VDAPSNCTCRPDSRTITADEVSIVLSCAACGGWAVIITDHIDGCAAALTKIKAEFYRGLGEIAPPGKGIIATCRDCAGPGCDLCHGTGRRLWKACPRCGDIGFDFINGHDGGQGMVCRIGCGYRWSADDPRWLAQRLPA